MCRLFGLLGNGRTPAEPWLVDTDRALIRQADALQDHLQVDGWGIGWFTEKRGVRIEKGVGNAASEEEAGRFRAAARAAHGPLAVGHLRKASNPMRLPHERLVGLENTQPFVHESTLFIHNGSIPFPRETRARLGEFEPLVKGVNDSEVLFWLLVRHLEAGKEPPRAYADTVNDLVEIWREKGSPSKGPYSGLNVVFSRGPNELWAFCQYLGDHGPGILDRSRPYYQMTYVADAKHVVVGSEPFDSTRSDWRPLSNGEYLVAEATHGLVAVRTGAIPPPAELPRPTVP